MIAGFEESAKATSFGSRRAIAAFYAVSDLHLAQFEQEKRHLLVNDLICQLSTTKALEFSFRCLHKATPRSQRCLFFNSVIVYRTYSFLHLPPVAAAWRERRKACYGEESMTGVWI